MKRAFLFFAIAIAALICNACSYLTYFVVINVSNKTVVVSYKMKPLLVGPAGSQKVIERTIDIPKTTPASQLESKEGKQWHELPPERFEVDHLEQIVKVKLQPQDSLSIGRLSNYTEPAGERDLREFPIEELQIAGSTGYVKYSGQQTLKAFSRRSISLYTLTYQ